MKYKITDLSSGLFSYADNGMVLDQLVALLRRMGTEIKDISIKLVVS